MWPYTRIFKHMLRLSPSGLRLVLQLCNVQEPNVLPDDGIFLLNHVEVVSSLLYMFDVVHLLVQ